MTTTDIKDSIAQMITAMIDKDNPDSIKIADEAGRAAIAGKMAEIMRNQLAFDRDASTTKNSDTECPQE